MKLTKQLSIAAIGLLCASAANAYMIDDNHAGASTYWGGDHHGYGDVIGDKSKFDILGLDLSVSGTTLTVDIFTNFAGLGDDKLFASLTDKDASKVNGVKQGIGYGDLFLASSWTPFGSGNYANDNHITGTKWEYGFALDNRWSATGGVGTLYQLSSTDSNNYNTLLSQDFLSGGTFRDGQEVAVDTSKSRVTNTGVTGSWNVYSDRISMTFDIGGTGLLDNGALALHWNMTCGNDTIEGEVPVDVPEPSTLALMALSVLGLGIISRRRRS